MRISLLLEREPFGSILESTLEKFWTEFYGDSFEVTWTMGSARERKSTVHGRQKWLCNTLLNAIFVKGIADSTFDPIRNEYSFTSRKWLKTTQRAYVNLALSTLFAPMFAQARLYVQPPVPDAGQLLILGGNQKIHLLNRDENCVYSVVKAGFEPSRLQTEIEIRSTAADNGVSIPAILDRAQDNTWIKEQYIYGTPSNRVKSTVEREHIFDTAFSSLNGLIAATGQSESTVDYTSMLMTRIEDLLEKTDLVDSALKGDIRLYASTLIDRLGSKRDTVETSLTHGDFQPANILWDGLAVWVIDWEYAARRQKAYDYLVFGLKSRAGPGLAARLAQFIRDGRLDIPESIQRDSHVMEMTSVEDRTFNGLIFMLEELVVQLEENSPSVIRKIGRGLTILVNELKTIAAGDNLPPCKVGGN